MRIITEESYSGEEFHKLPDHWQVFIVTALKNLSKMVVTMFELGIPAEKMASNIELERMIDVKERIARVSVMEYNKGTRVDSHGASEDDEIN
jgi:hypothetical protein